MRIVTATIFLMALLVALNLAYSVPFYFSWDMDLTTVLDLFRINDGKIPTHINHPGLGFYWIFAWLQKPALWMELITPLHMGNLGTSLEPILIVAEHMDFLRGINAFVCILIPLVAYVAIVPRDLDRKFSLLVLLVLLTMPALWRFNVLLIRTETVSLLSWVFSLLFAIRAASVPKGNWNAIISGFFASLSFFTKIQSLFLIAMVPLIYWLLASRREIGPETAAARLKNWPLVVFAILFFILSVAALGLPDPTYVATWSDFYAPNKFLILFVVLLIAVFVLQKPQNRGWVQQHSATQMVFFLNKFVMGIGAVMLVPFLFLSQFGDSVRYALLNFKMIFLRWTRYGSLGEIPLLDNFVSIAKSHFFFLGLFLLIAVWLIYAIRGLQRKQQLFGIALCISVLMVFHIVLGVRGRLQDGIWIELPVLIFTVLFLVFFVSRKSLKYAVSACIVLVNLAHVRDWRNPESSLAYFDSHVFFEEVYQFNSYWDIMLPAYTNRVQKDQAIDFALNWRRWRNLVFNNFPASGLDLRDVSFIESSLEPVVSLSRVEQRRIDLRYRPDIAQFLLFKDGVGDSKTAPCVHGKKIEIRWRGSAYIGHEILGAEADRPFPFLCEIESDALSSAIVVTRQVAVSTYRNTKLRIEAPTN